MKRINVICEECGEACTFPLNQRGTVQRCSHCDAYVDVEEPNESVLEGTYTASDNRSGEGEPFNNERLLLERAATAPEDPPSGGEQFESVWFATDEKRKSLFNWFVFSDQGKLKLSPQDIQFMGNRFHLHIQEVKEISLIRGPIPWLNLGLTNCLGGLFLMTGLREADVWNIVFATTMLLLINLFFVVGSSLRKWIRVEYANDTGVSQHAYFADGFSKWGGGKVGRSLQMLLGMSMLADMAADRLRRWLPGGEEGCHRESETPGRRK